MTDNGLSILSSLVLRFPPFILTRNFSCGSVMLLSWFLFPLANAAWPVKGLVAGATVLVCLMIGSSVLLLISWHVSSILGSTSCTIDFLLE